MAPNVAGLLQRELSLIVSFHENDTEGKEAEAQAQAEDDGVDEFLGGLPNWVKYLLKIVALGGGL
jgi:hypothetical protein